MKIFITGICGFVGSTLARCLAESAKGYEIFGIDNFVRPGSWLNKAQLNEMGVRVYHGDIRMESDLALIPKADWVIDAAANPSVMAGVDGRTSSLQLVQHNLSATVNVLEYCKRHQAGFILLSTSRVYSMPGLCTIKLNVENEGFIPDVEQQFPPGLSFSGVNEHYSTMAPISLYGCTKLSSEQLALEYGLAFDFPVWVNRCGVLAGARQFGHPGQGIFAYWIHSFKEKRPLKYIGFGGTGFQVRDCLHPVDIVSLLIKQFNEPLISEKPRIINLSGGVENSMSLVQLSNWCNQYFGLDYAIEATQTHRAYDIPWMVLDSTKAKEVWSWAPQTGMNSILQEIAAFAESQENWCDISMAKP